jgi:hypothetical protein
MKHCPACNSQRQGDACWKCGTETIVPHESWEYPELPPVAPIREVAKQAGYAIGEHGSRERDLDLIAVPWTKDAVSSTELISRICQAINANVVGDIAAKPFGRVAVILSMAGWYRPIDLSITPRATEE